MRLALDATQSLGADLSGVGVYSRELLNGLAKTKPFCQWEWFYRSQKFCRAMRSAKPENVTRRFLAESWGNRGADLFHGLNQRLPKRRFLRQVATFHDLFVLSGDYSTPEFRERFAAQAREAAAGADLIVAVSAFTARQVESYLHVPGERIRVIHHGVVSRAIPAAPREKIVLCVGAIQRRKNQMRLVRAFRAMPEGWVLVLAGSAGFDAGEVIQEAESSSRSGDIRITGYVTDSELAGWYGRASIFAFPSLDEGFGMPVLEAMAAGIPVIAGNRSALPEVCGDAAKMIDPENEDELAAALMDLAQNAALREDFIARGFERAHSFRWADSVERTFSVYGELL